MKKRNIYYVIGVSGLILNFLTILVLSLVVDPYFASIFIPFLPVWIIVLVVGYRKAHPRR